jgi:adenylate cyclase
LAEILRNAGRQEEAIASYKKAIRLNPFPQSHFYHGLARSYFFTGQYEEAIAACKKALHRNPDNVFAHLALAASYASSGREEEAHAEAAEALRINPNLSLEYIAKTWPTKKQAETELYVNALRKAGLK